jgi:hypothetical protein
MEAAITGVSALRSLSGARTDSEAGTALSAGSTLSFPRIALSVWMRGDSGKRSFPGDVGQLTGRDDGFFVGQVKVLHTR